MVGFVIVSHSGNLAKSVVELTAIMAPSARIAAAGGMDDGGFGTSFEKIQAAIESVYSDDGVLVLMDMGSAVMTTEMVIETFEGKKVEMVDSILMIHIPTGNGPWWMVQWLQPLTLWAEWTLRQSRRRWQEWGHPGSSEAGGFIPGSQEGCIVCYKTASFADDPGVTRTAGQSSFSLP